MFLQKSKKQKNSKSIPKKIFWILFFAIVFRLFLAPIIWHPDINNHVDWGIRFWEYGPAKFYTANVWSFTWPNQPPGTTYLFAGVRKLFEGVFDVIWMINVKIPAFPSIIASFSETNLYQGILKLPAILSDVGIGILIYKILKKLGKTEKVATWGLALWMINPAIWYNSAVWGQYDSVINFLALLSFYLLSEKKLMLSLLILAISLYTKASLLIFLPIYGVIAIRQKYNWKKWFLSIVITLGVIALLTLPFSKGEPFTWLFYLFKDKIFAHQLQVITANAFNLWTVIAGIHERPQTLPFLCLTYQYWSYIIFGIAYLPLLWISYKKQDLKTILWVLALTAFSSFMLLTNMHERYLFPLFPYLTILAASNSVGLIPYFLISILSLLNLYNLWWMPKITPLIDFLSYKNRFTPRILGLFNFVLYLNLYRAYIKDAKKN